MIGATRVLLLGIITAAGVVGCGGGGSPAPAPAPPPVNTTPPVASISSIGPAQRVVGQNVNFTGTGTTPTTAGLTYSWTFGDGVSANGASVIHAYATHGDYTVTLTARDSGGLTHSTTQTIHVDAPPAVPVVTASATHVIPGGSVTFSAASTDPQGSALTYSWLFADGSTATGASVSHTFPAEGLTSVRATATNALGLASSYTMAMSVGWLPLVAPAVWGVPSSLNVGETLSADSGFVEPNGLPFTTTWDYGDGATSTGASASHQYNVAGSFTVKITVANSLGHSVSRQYALEVLPAVESPAPLDNVFQVYCAGARCGAQNTSTYGGSGVGVWRYHNATTANATIDVSIGGLDLGDAAFLVFSNGAPTNAAAVPLAGTAATPPGKIALTTAERASLAHEEIQARNRAMALELSKKSRGAPAKSSRPLPVARVAAPAIGATRVWRDGGTAYNLKVIATCPFSTGRNGVVWMDADQIQRGEIDSARGQAMADFLCASNGAYEKLVALHGDVWGSGATPMTNLIQDAPGDLLNLEVAILGVPMGTGWAGYFSSGNLLSGTVDPDSNQALSVVMNGRYVANMTADDPFPRITLAHEIKHLINYYQRSIVRGRSHSAWLEETSAMLAEELLGTQFEQSRTEARIGGYAGSQGGISYVNWSHPEGNSYNQGGSLGSFLHRRYGTGLDVYLVDSCDDSVGPAWGYQCLEDYIVSRGGAGFADEFARMGASTLGRMGWNTPVGFGFPAKSVGGFDLKPVGNGAFEAAVSPARDLGGVFRATEQTYDYDFMDAGQTSFVRNGVVIPAGVTLMVVVNEAPQ